MNMSKVDERISKLVEEKNVANVREILGMMAYMADSNDFEIFVDSAEYAKTKLSGLFMPNREVSVKKSSEYKTAAAKLMEVFSQENYEEVLRVGRVVFAGEQLSKENKSKKNGYNHSASNKNNKEENTKSVKIPFIGFFAVAFAILIWIILR